MDTDIARFARRSYDSMDARRYNMYFFGIDPKRSPDYYALDAQRILRERWGEMKTGIELRTPERLPSPSELRRSERSAEFDTLRANRKIMGAMRYGLFGAEGKPDWDRVKAMELKLSLYRRDRNREHLVDLANYAELEFAEGRGHFKATDDANHCLAKGE